MSTLTDDRIREALADLLDLAPPVSSALADGTASSVGPPEHRRWPVLVAAAAVVAIGIAGLVVATRPAADDEHIPSTEVGGLAQYTGWYLPTYIPVGFEITGIAAEPASPSERATPEWWSRLNANGEVDALFAVRAFPVEDHLPDDAEFTGNGATVHGLPAVVEIESTNALSVTWVEGDWYVWASAAYLTDAEALEAAEAVRVNPESGRGEFPSGAPHGLELRTLDADVPSNGVHLDIGLRRIDHALGESVDIFVVPNTFQYTSGTLWLSLHPDAAWERIAFDGTDAIFYQSEQRGAPSAVKWVAGGLLFMVRGELEVDELVAIAAGLRPATVEGVLAEGERITERIRRLPVLDETTFGDGTRVTVQTHGSDGAAAICVESVALQCDRPNYVGNVAASVHDAIFSAFEIGGQDVIFGWRRGDEGPTLGFDGGTTGSVTIDDLVHTEIGHFVRVRVPPGEPRPQLQYSDVTYSTPSRIPSRIVDFGS